MSLEVLQALFRWGAISNLLLLSLSIVLSRLFLARHTEIRQDTA